MTKLYIGFIEVTQQTFPVVSVVWISIAVLPVKIINPKNNYSYVKTNQKSEIKFYLSWLAHPRSREIWPRTNAVCPLSKSQRLAKEGRGGEEWTYLELTEP